MLLSCALFCAAVLVFTYLGYPLLAVTLARLAPRPVRRAAGFPFLSVVLPAHREGRRLREKLSQLRSQKYPCGKLEIIAVLDGCAQEAEAERLVASGLADRVICFPERRGKAAALNAGMRAAAGEVIVFTDARQTLAPRAIAALAENFADDEVTAVTGRLVTSSPPGGPGAEGLFRRYEEGLRRAEAAWGSCAGATGALYALRATAAAPIPEDTILDDLVISLSAAAQGRLVYEPRATATEPPGGPHRTKRRRIRTLAGNWQIALRPLAYRSIFSRRTVLQLLCHKGLRIVCPFFAAGLAVSLAVLWPLATALAAASGAAVLAAGRTFSRRGAGALSEAAESLLFAPVAALFGYLSGRETVVWAR